MRPLAKPAGAPRLTERNVFVIHVAHLPHRGHAFERHAADFARRELQQRRAALLRNQLRLRTRGPRHLRALSGPQLDVVDNRSGGHISHGHGIAHQNVGFRAGHHLLPHLQPVGLNNVTLLAIRIVQQGDARRTVGIVLDGGDHGGDARLVALEIHHPIGLFRAAPDEAGRNASGAGAAAGALLRFHQRLFRTLPGNIVARNHRLEAAGRRCGSICLNRHRLNPREVGDLLPFLQLDVGLLPVRAIA